MEKQDKKNEQYKQDLSVEAFDKLEGIVETQVKKSFFGKVKEIPGRIKNSVVESTKEGSKVLPKVGLWSLASWALGVGSVFARYGGWNPGYNIAAGAGLAGGLTDSRAQKIVTGLALAASITPDVIYSITSDKHDLSGIFFKGAAYTACYAASHYTKKWWQSK